MAIRAVSMMATVSVQDDTEVDFEAIASTFEQFVTDTANEFPTATVIHSVADSLHFDNPDDPKGLR